MDYWLLRQTSDKLSVLKAPPSALENQGDLNGEESCSEQSDDGVRERLYRPPDRDHSRGLSGYPNRRELNIEFRHCDNFYHIYCPQPVAVNDSRGNPAPRREHDWCLSSLGIGYQQQARGGLRDEAATSFFILTTFSESHQVLYELYRR